MHFFSNFLNIIVSAATHGGYVFLFFISIIESVPFIGSFVPGHTAVILSGFLAKTGVFNLWAVILIASSGAIIGDMIGFYLGRHYGLGLISKLKPYFFIKDEHINKARSLIGRHTGKALIIGRFNPITRPLMPFIVGSSDSNINKFWIWNIIGGILWATTSVMLGYVFGLGYHAFAGTLGKLILAVTILTLLIIWGYRFVNERFHIFRKYELFALGLNLLSLWVLAKTIQDAWAVKSFMANFDVVTNLFMAQHVVPIIVWIAKGISIIGSVEVMVALSIVMILYYLTHHKWRKAILYISAMSSTGIFLGAMKEFFLRDRPDNALMVLSDPSFPSGHASMIAAFFVIVAYNFSFCIKNRAKREWVIVLSALAIFVVGLSRIILNVHWASDVVAGWALGIFMATASILLVRYVGALVQRK